MVLDRHTLYALIIYNWSSLFADSKTANYQWAKKFICNIKTSLLHSWGHSVSMTRAAATQAAWYAHTPAQAEEALLCLPVSAPAGRPLSSLCRVPLFAPFSVADLLFEMTPMCSAKCYLLFLITREVMIVCEENMC